MPLAFGLTVVPDPPSQRLIEVRALGEQHGFEYGWTHDSRGTEKGASPGSDRGARAMRACSTRATR
jgi:hypothetical protein